jgi:hypothetical protein
VIILRTGDLAYLDTVMSGLVPVKVLSIVNRMGREEHGPLSNYEIRYKVTATRYAYARGYQNDTSGRLIVPRSAVYKPRGSFFPRIRAYVIEADRPLRDSDGRTYGHGDRVELVKYTVAQLHGEAFQPSAQFGTVVRTSITPRDRVTVQMDSGQEWTGAETDWRRVL